MAAYGQNTLKGALDKLERGNDLAKIDRQGAQMRKALGADPAFAKLAPQAQADHVRGACVDWNAMKKLAAGHGR
jgi:hypothetical protein